MSSPVHAVPCLLLVASLAMGCLGEPPMSTSPVDGGPDAAQDTGREDPDLAPPEPTCDDGEQNGVETDVDCGGECSACGLREGCQTADDCAEGLCVERVCALATCTDDIQDGDETDVDCGGPGCPPCDEGEICLEADDCASVVCDQGVCAAPTCDDAITNGDETAPDCGGDDCEPCDVGSACEEDDDCATDVCGDDACLPPASCRAWLEVDPDLTDGMYTIDADGTGPAPQVEVFCDMTTHDGAGYTMLRVDDPRLDDENSQQPYRRVCRELGMEIIVPRTRAHALSIRDYNGGTPANLINVYPERDGAAGLNDFEGICGGEPCDFWVTDREWSYYSGGWQPDGDNVTGQSLVLIGAASADSPFGLWNDAQDFVDVTGWVLCSTNDDAGPPAFSTCLGIAEDGAQVNTDELGSRGIYAVEPETVDGPVDVICDFRTDGGGYSFLKVELTEEQTAKEADEYCSERGMQLLVPRSRPHRFASFEIATYEVFGPSASQEYMQILNVFPDSDGARCDYRPFRSQNADCDWGAADDGPFYIHGSTSFAEPSGNEGGVDVSLLYEWWDDGGLRFIADVGASAATSDRFICHFGDKLP